MAVLVAIVIGLIPAFIARHKGHNFLGWWIYGTLIFIVALPHALFLKRNEDAIELRQLAQGMKKCPFCAELIKVDATVCRYCGRDLAVSSTPANIAPSKDNHELVKTEKKAQGITSGE